MSDKPRNYGWTGLQEEAQRLEAEAKSLEPVIKRELEIMGLCKNTKILDAGCGTGAATRKISKIVSAGEVVGMDIDALFIETHPNPEDAKSDAASQLPLDQLEGVLQRCLRIYEAATIQ